MRQSLSPELTTVDLSIFDVNPHVGQFDVQGTQLWERMFGSVRELRDQGIIKGPLLESLQDERTSQRVNRWALRNYTRNYGLPGVAYGQRFFMDQQNTAFRVIERYKASIPALRGVLGLKNELRSDQPTDYYEWMNRPDVAPRLAFEAKRGLALAFISGVSDVRDFRIPLEAEGGRIQKHIDKEGVFAGLIGDGKPKVITAQFDDITNSVVDSFSLNGTHEKRILTEVREVEGVGATLTILRKKEAEVATIKSIWKAELDARKGVGTTIRPMDVVNDHFGMLFMTLEDGANIELLMEKVLGALFTYTRKMGQITPDFHTNGDQGQSGKLKLDGRLLTYFKGLNGNPFELMFFSKNNYLNSQFEVGSLNPHTGMYDGQAHELYELQREGIVAPRLFPDTHYRVRRAFEHASQKKTEELLERNKSSDVIRTERMEPLQTVEPKVEEGRQVVVSKT